MKLLEKILPLLVIATVAVFGFWLGTRISNREVRDVDISRMEQCLRLYKSYRHDLDQVALAKSLQEIELTPRDFQEIIDRFIFYRTRKSAQEQAMELLRAFRLGYDIEIESVVMISDFYSEPFRLDAEILAVFEENPELIKEAFEG